MVVEEEREWETGVEKTRVMTGDVSRGGARMVETELPRERTAWVLWEGRGTDGGRMAWLSGEGSRAELELESDDCGDIAGGEAIGGV